MAARQVTKKKEKKAECISYSH